MVEVSGGTLFRGPALGSWEHVHDQEYDVAQLRPECKNSLREADSPHKLGEPWV